MAESGATAPLLEVFSSIQGEGVHVGRRQVFVRAVGCNLSCEYCDTPATRQSPPLVWSVFTPDGEVASHPNPATVDEALTAVWELEGLCGPHHSLVITGGEPLLHPEFTGELARRARKEGLAVHLETNSTLADALETVLHCVDVVAADLKLRSATGQDAPLEASVAFISMAAEAGMEVFCKIIVTDGTDMAELEAAARALAAAISRDIPLVIQPATAIPGKGFRAPSGATLAEMQRICLRDLADVRVIPQCHKILRLR